MARLLLQNLQCLQFVLLVAGSHGVLSFCPAFTAVPLGTTSIRQSHVSLNALPAPLLSGVQSSFLTIAADEDVPFESAFQDSVSLTDGPVGVIFAAFALFVVLAVGFKAVMGQMDSAIEKVIRDFEATLREYYPKRWRAIEDMELKGLTGDERDIKLLQVMERLQQEEPAFMTQVAERGAPPTSSEVVDAEIVSSSEDKQSKEAQ